MHTGRDAPGSAAIDQESFGQLRQLIMGFRITQLIHVAAKLGLADHLALKAQTATELARSVAAEPGPLYRLLRALASVGVFSESAGGVFEMTPMAELLCSDRPGSLRSTAILYGDEVVWDAYGRLSHAVASGRPAFDHLYGQPFYDYLGQHPATAALFHEAMTGFSEQEATAILAAWDFPAIRMIVDVGGGQGALMAALLRAHPQLQAVIFDQSPPGDDARRLFADPDIGARARFVQGDFFAAVPEGADLYVLKSVVHNWNDPAAVAILRACRAAMPPRGRLLLAERVVPLGNEPAEAKLFDINMLVTAGGQERTEAEYARLFQAAGLEMKRVISTGSPLSLVEAMPKQP
jgi:O-methyltransferase domain/Dimerisation domain